MPDEFLDVVFGYESVPDDHLETVSSSVDAVIAPCEIETGDIDGLLDMLEPDAGARGSPDLPRITFRLQENHFVPDEPTFEASYAERFDRFLGVIRDIYSAGSVRPGFVYAVQYHMARAIAEIGTPPVDADSLATEEINYAVWLNVFPPALVDTYDRDRLLDAPAWRTEAWDDGAILIVAYEEPLCLDMFSDLNEYLGLDDPGL